MRDHPNCRFIDLKQVFDRQYQIVQNGEQMHLQFKNLK
jgi:hypothetical protein